MQLSKIITAKEVFGGEQCTGLKEHNIIVNKLN